MKRRLTPISILPALALLAGCAALIPGRNPLLASSSVETREDTAVYRAHYRAGGMRSELKLVHGKREGATVLYFADGSREYTCGYRGGRAEGEALAFFPGGKRRMVEHYVGDTLRVDRTLEFDSTGALVSEWIPEGDSLTGFLIYRRNGQVMHSTRYAHGKRDGMSFSMGPKGDTVTKTFFRDGKEDTAAGKRSFSNQRNTESILKTIRKHTPALRHTYNAHRAQGRFRGKVTLKFRIRPDGRLDYVLPIEDNSGRPRFVRDVVNRVQDWKFEAIDSAADDVVTVPFTFSE